MAGRQRIDRVRRQYNQWVANQTLEDYALRFTPQRFRKWSTARVANTAFGAASFLILEAVGATLLVKYGFANAFWAILMTGLIIFLAGLPISVYAARYGVDMDLLTRGAGFGYIGSTLTSLIYASFTFIFFALEAAVMAYALELALGIPPTWGPIHRTGGDRLPAPRGRRPVGRVAVVAHAVRLGAADALVRRRAVVAHRPVAAGGDVGVSLPRRVGVDRRLRERGDDPVRNGSATRRSEPPSERASPCHSFLVSRSPRKTMAPSTTKMGPVEPISDPSLLTLNDLSIRYMKKPAKRG